jgi:hypothetical protein
MKPPYKFTIQDLTPWWLMYHLLRIEGASPGTRRPVWSRR